MYQVILNHQLLSMKARNILSRIGLSAALLLGSVAVNAQNTHTVKQGETLYSISRQYGVSVNDLVAANGSDIRSGLKIGQKINLATAANGVAGTAITLPAANSTSKVHIVNRGETLYAICKKHNVTLQDIKAWNKLSDLDIRPGQKLLVSKPGTTVAYKPRSVPSTPDTPYQEEDIRPRTAQTPVKTEANVVAEKAILETPQVKSASTEVVKPSPVSAEYPDVFNQYSLQGLKLKKARGTANYLTAETSGNQNLAFYNNAESGSIIRVTNMLNQKTIFVKVLGKVPAMDIQQEVMLKLSSKAAEELGAAESKFLVEVASYQ